MGNIGVLQMGCCIYYKFPTKYFRIELCVESGVGKWGEGIPLPSRLGVWGSVVSSPSGVRGGAPAANAFVAYLRSTEHFW